MKRPTVQPRTRLAHAAAKWAADNDRFQPFSNALFRAFFQDGLDIGRLSVLADIAGKLDMDTDGLANESLLDAYIGKVLLDEETAKQLLVRAVPAYVFNGRILAAGVQSLPQLRQMLFAD